MLPNSNTIDLLSLSLLSEYSVAVADWKALLAGSEASSYRRGEFILTQGENNRYLYYVEYGLVKVRKILIAEMVFPYMK